MLITIFSYEVREVKFEETLRLLEQPSVSIRVKVARPDITSSVFSTNGDKEVKNQQYNNNNNNNNNDNSNR